MNLNPKDIQIDTYTNAVPRLANQDCVVYIIHVPTGIRVKGSSRKEAMEELANQFDKRYNVRLDYPKFCNELVDEGKLEEAKCQQTNL